MQQSLSQRKGIASSTRSNEPGVAASVEPESTTKKSRQPYNKYAPVTVHLVPNTKPSVFAEIERL
jgi:hypothetical protein